LSPTHIHEFKSADRIYTQPPVMSLYLPDQKLGSRSQPGSSSHKFVIKGRQTGSMHRGHTWVFRAETYETMMAWYDDIKVLTEKSGEERNAFVRRHASVRSTSAGSARSASSDGGLEEDEADAVPYSANQSLVSQPVRQESTRPSPGGRFPSDLNVNRNLQAPLSPSSGSSDYIGHDLTTAAGGPTQDIHPMYLDQAQPVQPVQAQQAYPAASYVNSYPPTQEPYQNPTSYMDSHGSAQQTYETQPPMANTYAPAPQQYGVQPGYADPAPVERHESSYGDWMGPAAGGAAAGALATEAYRRNQMEQQERAQQQEMNTQAQLQNQEQHYPIEQPSTTGFVGAVPAVPERDPDHHAPASFIDVQDPRAAVVHPVLAAGSSHEATRSHPEGNLATPSTANTSFLDNSEVGAAVPASGKTINGGPVPVGLVEVADAQAHPGMHRTNTDISVSDLHVPGEYPKGPAPKVPAPVTEETLIQM
jgi:hypothetical protein